MNKFITIFALLALASSTYQAKYSNACNIKDLVYWHDQVRMNPRGFAKKIKAVFKDNMDSTGLLLPFRLRFSEKHAVIDETINYLNSVAKCTRKIQTVDLGFTELSWEHSKYQIEVIKRMSHYGPTGRYRMSDRSKVCDKMPSGVPIRWAENIVDCNSRYTGTVNIPGEGSFTYDANFFAVAMWMIDNAVPSRGHRLNIMKCYLEEIGFGIFPHSSTKDRVTALFSSNGFTTTCNFTSTQKKKCCWTAF